MCFVCAETVYKATAHAVSARCCAGCKPIKLQHLRQGKNEATCMAVEFVAVPIEHIDQPVFTMDFYLFSADLVVLSLFVQVRAAVLCRELEENQSAIMSSLQDAGDSDSDDEDEQMVVEVEVPQVRGDLLFPAFQVGETLKKCLLWFNCVLTYCPIIDRV